MTLENTDLSRRKLLRTTAIGVPAAGVVALGANLVMAPAANAETDLGAKMKVESEKLQEKAQRAKELADSFDLDAAAFDDPALEAAVKDISGQLHDAAQKPKRWLSNEPKKLRHLKMLIVKMPAAFNNSQPIV